jgi:uncharacterized phage infection (PIP) family protein YhgE
MPGNVGEFSVKVTADLTDFKSKMDEVNRILDNSASEFLNFRSIVTGATESMAEGMLEATGNVSSMANSVNSLSTSLNNLTGAAGEIGNMSAVFEDAREAAGQISEGVNMADASAKSLGKSVADATAATRQMADEQNRNLDALTKSAATMETLTGRRQAEAQTTQTTTGPVDTTEFTDKINELKQNLDGLRDTFTNYGDTAKDVVDPIADSLTKMSDFVTTLTNDMNTLSDSMDGMSRGGVEEVGVTLADVERAAREIEEGLDGANASAQNLTGTTNDTVASTEQLTEQQRLYNELFGDANKAVSDLVAKQNELNETAQTEVGLKGIDFSETDNSVANVRQSLIDLIRYFEECNAAVAASAGSMSGNVTGFSTSVDGLIALLNSLVQSIDEVSGASGGTSNIAGPLAAAQDAANAITDGLNNANASAEQLTQGISGATDASQQLVDAQNGYSQGVDTGINSIDILIAKQRELDEAAQQTASPLPDVSTAMVNLDVAKQSLDGVIAAYAEYEAAVGDAVAAGESSASGMAEGANTSAAAVNDLTDALDRLTGMAGGMGGVGDTIGEAGSTADRIAEGLNQANESAQNLNAATGGVAQTSEQLAERQKSWNDLLNEALATMQNLAAAQGQLGEVALPAAPEAGTQASTGSINDATGAFDALNNLATATMQNVSGSTNELTEFMDALLNKVNEVVDAFGRLADTASGMSNISSSLETTNASLTQMCTDVAAADTGVQNINVSATNLPPNIEQAATEQRRHTKAVEDTTTAVGELTAKQQALVNAIKNASNPEQMQSDAMTKMVSSMINTTALQGIWNNVIFGNSGVLGKMFAFGVKSLVDTTNEYSKRSESILKQLNDAKLTPQQLGVNDEELARMGIVANGGGGYVRNIGGTGGMNFGGGGSGAGNIFVQALMNDLMMGGGGASGIAGGAAKLLGGAGAGAGAAGTAAEAITFSAAEIEAAAAHAGIAGSLTGLAGEVTVGGEAVAAGAAAGGATVTAGFAGMVSGVARAATASLTGLGTAAINLGIQLSTKLGLPALTGALTGLLGTAVAPIIGTVIAAGIGIVIGKAVEGLINTALGPLGPAIEELTATIGDCVQQILEEGARLQETRFQLNMASGSKETGQYNWNQAKQIANGSAFEDYEVAGGMTAIQKAIGGKIGSDQLATLTDVASKAALISGTSMEAMGNQIGMALLRNSGRSFQSLKMSTNVDLTDEAMSKRYGEDKWKEMNNDEKKNARIDYLQSDEVQKTLAEGQAAKLETINGQLMMLKKNQDNVGEWFRDFANFAVAPLKLLNAALEVQSGLMAGLGETLYKYTKGIGDFSGIGKDIKGITDTFKLFFDMLNGKDTAEGYKNLSPEMKKVFDTLVTVRDVFTQIEDAMEYVISFAGKLYKENIEPMIEFLINNGLPVFNKIADFVGNNIVPVVRELLGWFNLIVTVAREIFGALAPLGGDAAGGIFKGITDALGFLNKMFDSVKQAAKAFYGFLLVLFDPKSSLQDKLVALGQMIVVILGEALKVMINILVAGAQTLVNIMTWLMQTIMVTIPGTAVNFLLTIFVTLWNTIIDIFKVYGGFMLTIMLSLFTALSKIFFGGWDGLKSVFADGLNGILGIVGEIGKKIIEAAKYVGSGIFDGIWGGVKAAVNAVTEWAGGNEQLKGILSSLGLMSANTSASTAAINEGTAKWVSDLDAATASANSKNGQYSQSDMEQYIAGFNGMFDSFKLNEKDWNVNFLMDAMNSLIGGMGQGLNNGIGALGNLAIGGIDSLVNSLAGGLLDKVNKLFDDISKEIPKEGEEGGDGTPEAPPDLTSAVQDLGNAIQELGDTVDSKKMDVQITVKITQTFEGKVTEADLVDAAKTMQQTLDKTFAKYPGLGVSA